MIAEVRRRGLPAALPADQAFDPARPRLGAAYEAAWLACVVVADAAGVAALVELYRAVDAGVPIERAMRRAVGFGEAELVRRWRTRLSDLAG